MRNTDGATPNKLANDSVSGDNIARYHLLRSQAFRFIEEALYMIITNQCVQKPGIRLKIGCLRQQTVIPDEKRTKRWKIEGETAVDDMVRQSAQRNDTE